MLKIKQQISEIIADRLAALYPQAEVSAESVQGMLEYPPDDKMGDLALPCFKMSKALRCAPVKIAEQIAEGFNAEGLASAEALNGYLNIKISNEYLSEHILPEILEAGESYGAPKDMGEGKTVVLDYCSPNLAKPFHIGHLGTTVIGHSLKKLHEFAGYKCVGINYVGDWGTQFGKMMVAYKKWGDRKTVEEGGVDALVDLYVR